MGIVISDAVALSSHEMRIMEHVVDASVGVRVSVSGTGKDRVNKGLLWRGQFIK
jgi:hypothetical protein